MNDEELFENVLQVMTVSRLEYCFSIILHDKYWDSNYNVYVL